jgi:hypothetical protein
MSWREPEPTFRIGQRAEHAEFRHSDVHGNVISPAAATAEGETARAERIRKLAALRDASGPREAPPASPRAVLAEWLVANPLARTGAFGRALAEKGEEAVPRMVIELPGRPPAGDALIGRPRRMAAGVTPTELPGRPAAPVKPWVRSLEAPGR